MKRLSLLMGCLMAATVLMAQGNFMRDEVKYHEGNYLRQKGNNLYFVKVDVEWPEYLEDSACPHLHELMCEKLFSQGPSSLEMAMQRYLDSLGEPLQQVPDTPGMKAYYVNCELAEVDYEKGHYLSMLMLKTVIPRDTTEKKTIDHTLFTYNIPEDQVWQSDFMLRKSCFKDHPLRSELMMSVMSVIPEEITNYVDWNKLPSDACWMKMGMVFDLCESEQGDGHNELVALPAEDVRDFLSRDFLKFLKKVPEKVADVTTTQPWAEVVRADSVYAVAEEMPSFRNGVGDLSAYYKSNVVYPSYEYSMKIEGKVVVSFIVNSDGTVTEPRVVTPVSPGLDREAVRVVKSMPRWNPGKREGKPVSVRYSLPFSFKIKE